MNKHFKMAVAAAIFSLPLAVYATPGNNGNGNGGCGNGQQTNGCGPAASPDVNYIGGTGHGGHGGHGGAGGSGIGVGVGVGGGGNSSATGGNANATAKGGNASQGQLQGQQQGQNQGQGQDQSQTAAAIQGQSSKNDNSNSNKNNSNAANKNSNANSGNNSNVASTTNVSVGGTVVERSAPSVYAAEIPSVPTSCRLYMFGGGTNVNGAVSGSIPLGNDQTCLSIAALNLMERVGGFTQQEKQEVVCKVEGMEEVGTCKKLTQGAQPQGVAPVQQSVEVAPQTIVERYTITANGVQRTQ